MHNLITCQIADDTTQCSQFQLLNSLHYILYKSYGICVIRYLCHMVFVSYGICVIWYLCHMVFVSYGICFIWYLCHTVFVSYGICVIWYLCHTVFVSLVLEGRLVVRPFLSRLQPKHFPGPGSR